MLDGSASAARRLWRQAVVSCTCSRDGGLLEVKVVSRPTTPSLSMLLQVQIQLECTDAPFCDLAIACVDARTLRVWRVRRDTVALQLTTYE